jgi:hypothetical protein
MWFDRRQLCSLMGQGRADKPNTTAGNKQAQNVSGLPMRMAYDYSPG